MTQVVTVGGEDGSLRVSVKSKAAGKDDSIFNCSFDRVFSSDATQEMVYSAVRDRVLPATKGINCTVFAYGQTGTGACGCGAECFGGGVLIISRLASGKTHTMLGRDLGEGTDFASVADATWCAQSLAVSVALSLSRSLLSALCSLLSALCSLLSALCSLLSALCSLLSALCSLLSALCSLLSALCSLLSALCSLLSALCSLLSALCVSTSVTASVSVSVCVCVPVCGCLRGCTVCLLCVWVRDAHRLTHSRVCVLGRGVVPRAVSDLFGSLSTLDSTTEAIVYCSFMQVGHCPLSSSCSHTPRHSPLCHTLSHTHVCTASNHSCA
jgi:hypothetical protein